MFILMGQLACEGGFTKELFAFTRAWLGRLPGDIHIQRGSWTFYFPLATCLIISVVLTLLFSLFSRR